MSHKESGFPLSFNPSTMEIWKDIKGYDGIYQVSNCGRVKSLPRKLWNGKGFFISKMKILSISHNPDGYATVQLNYKNHYQECTVHRLVAEAFIPNPNKYPVINHKNEIKDDNRVCNLEWCTHAYNASYGTVTMRRRKKLSKPLVGIPIKGGDVVSFLSSVEASKNGFNGHHIIECCNGKRKTHKGYHWHWQNI